MLTKWLIEQFDDDDHIPRLISSLKKQRIEYHIIRYVPFESGSYDEYPNSSDQCVVFYGSLNLARQLRREKQWIPGVYCDLEKFKCTSYFPYLGKFLLNDDYVFIPVRELNRRKNWIYEKFGVDNCVFFRPNSGFKTFQGQIILRENFESEWNWMMEFSDEDSLAVVSSPKVINEEWRFIVCDKKIITGSLYKNNGRIDRQPFFEPNKSWYFAQEVANVWQPESAFIIDICSSNDSLYLVEINSFSCSGLYSCNTDIVVKEISNLAQKENFEENHYFS